MKYCPLHKNAYCEGSDCALAGDKDGNCLIHRFLEAFIDGEFEFEVSSPGRKEEPKFKPPVYVGDAPFSKLVKEWGK